MSSFTVLKARSTDGAIEDAICDAVSLGGDADTLGAISGSVADAFYGVPDEIRSKATSFLPGHLLDALNRAESMFSRLDGAAKRKSVQ